MKEGWERLGSSGEITSKNMLIKYYGQILNIMTCGSSFSSGKWKIIWGKTKENVLITNIEQVKGDIKGNNKVIWYLGWFLCSTWIQCYRQLHISLKYFYFSIFTWSCYMSRCPEPLFFSFPYALCPPKLTELHCIGKKWRKKCCADLSWRGYVHQREHSNLFVRRHGWEKRFPPAVRITLWTGFGFVALLKVGNTGKIFLRLGVGRSPCRDAVAERQLWGFIDNSSWSGQETV